MGKRKLGDSDSEDGEDDDRDEVEEEENNKSVVTENGILSDSSKEVDQSSGSVTDTKHDVVSFDGLPLESGSEEEMEMVAKLSQNPDDSGSDCAEGASVSQPALGVSEEKTSEEANEFCLETSVVSGMTENEVSKIFDSSNVVEEGVSHPSTLSSSGEKETSSAEVMHF